MKCFYNLGNVAPKQQQQQQLKMITDIVLFISCETCLKTATTDNIKYIVRSGEKAELREWVNTNFSRETTKKAIYTMIEKATKRGDMITMKLFDDADADDATFYDDDDGDDACGWANLLTLVRDCPPSNIYYTTVNGEFATHLIKKARQIQYALFDSWNLNADDFDKPETNKKLRAVRGIDIENLQKKWDREKEEAKALEALEAMARAQELREAWAMELREAEAKATKAQEALEGMLSQRTPRRENPPKGKSKKGAKKVCRCGKWDCPPRPPIRMREAGSGVWRDTTALREAWDKKHIDC